MSIADLEIEMDNRAKRRDRKVGKRTFAIPAGRVRDLVHFFSFTYGPVLPDDDAGRDDLFILAHHVAKLNGDPARNVSAHARQRCPWMGDDELAALLRCVLAKPIKWTADTLGRRLGLLDGVRTLLGITTIGAIDVPKAERERRRREQWNAKRRKQTRDEYEAKSLSKTKPWETEGVSRPTWYRRQKAARQVRVSKDLSRVTHTCLNPLPNPVAGPVIATTSSVFVGAQATGAPHRWLGSAPHAGILTFVAAKPPNGV
jgi:hypothetical protein